MEALNTYVELCQTIGPWTDWVQGPGGNFSVKIGGSDRIIVKKSGAVIAKTTLEDGWVECSASKIKEAYDNNEENIEHVVIKGKGKPSIETFFHIIESPIVVHLHPSNLLKILCKDFLPNHPKIKMVPYAKPGIPIAKEFFKIYQKDVPIYFLKNHGIIIVGNDADEIYGHLQFIKHEYIKTDRTTNINLVLGLRKKIPAKMIIKPFFSYINPSYHYYRLFFPYTPDIAVFLQKYPLSFESANESAEEVFDAYYEKHGIIPSVVLTPTMIYTIGASFDVCIWIEEILQAYSMIDSDSDSAFLDDAEVDKLINWDKEKERKTQAGSK